ncbi:MAG: small multi-drug export protein [Clostridia bacterium]|nr:small multi-drug export protein [Clostridia bacterium]
MDVVIEFLCNIFGAKLATLLGSMIPLIELKGSIMFARSAGLNFFESLLYSYIGSTFVFFVLFFLLIPVLNLLKKWRLFRSFAEGVEGYIQERTEKELNKKGVKGDGTRFKMTLVFFFVAIPLPMTGVWMGSAISVFLGLKFKEAVLPVALGNLIAGLLISLLAELLLPYVNIILYGLFAIAIILLFVFVVKVYFKSKSKKIKE